MKPEVFLKEPILQQLSKSTTLTNQSKILHLILSQPFLSLQGGEKHCKDVILEATDGEHHRL